MLNKVTPKLKRFILSRLQNGFVIHNRKILTNIRNIGDFTTIKDTRIRIYATTFPKIFTSFNIESVLNMFIHILY